jgi:hypothetical protein
MSRLNVGNLFNENEDGAPVVSGISTFSSPHYFVPPSGSTAERPQNPGEGMIRFNTDSGHLEYYSGELWVDVITNNNELGNHLVTNSAGGTGTRGVLMGGGVPGLVNDIDYITVETLGNSQDFGDLASTRRGSQNGQAGSRVKGLAMGGDNTVSTVASIIFASTGSATDTGSILTQGRRLGGGASNQTRALYAGGLSSPVARNTIDATDIASLGSSQDFGDLSAASYFNSGVSSSVRGVFTLGNDGGSYNGNIDYVTLSSQGNGQDFGDSVLATNPDGAGNSIRGVFSGGASPAYTNTIQFLTIATTGNSQDFGDLTSAKGMAGSVSSPTRHIHIAGRNGGGSMIDEMDYVTIMTTGNAISFGELVGSDRFRPTSGSNGHGGL